MKKRACPYHFFGPSLKRFLLGLGLTICAGAFGQNLLKNGDFEQPLGATNWTVGFIKGSAEDFDVRDRTRGGSKHAAWFGGQFRPFTQKTAHAYFGQTVSGLTSNHVYTITGSMKEDWWSNTTDHAFRDKFLVYIEAIGGQGAPLGDGRFSVIAATDPDPDIDPPYTYPTDIWRDFTALQIPDANGKIEVRLHYNKISYVIYDKTWIMSGYFDDIFLTP